MALTTTKLITSSETVAVLTALLGTARPWESFLAEVRRTTRWGLKPTLMHGEQLIPFGRVGKSPRYLVADVTRFIQAMWAADPGLRPKKLPSAPGIAPRPYEHDDRPLELGWSWKHRKLTPTS